MSARIEEPPDDVQTHPSDGWSRCGVSAEQPRDGTGKASIISGFRDLVPVRARVMLAVVKGGRAVAAGTLIGMNVVVAAQRGALDLEAILHTRGRARVRRRVQNAWRY